MGQSSYPQGFAGGVAIRNIPLEFTPSRKVYFVNNGSTLAEGGVAGVDRAGLGTYQRPFSTIDFSIGQCSAGDVILAMPGHAETLSTASAITADVAGISIYALGQGASRATLTFSNTAATIVVSAASVTFQNFIIKPSVDSVVSPFVVQAADCWIDCEIQDASASVEFVRAVLTTAAADRLHLDLKYRGFTAGNACVNAVRLVGVDTADINVDFYGVASTAVVEFHTTACTNITVNGYMYNSGTTDGSKLVVDTVTGSTWYADIQDGAAGARFTGGSASALASDDVSTVAANQTVPSADSTANVLERDVVGNKTDAAATGTVSTTESIMAYSKQLVTELTPNVNSTTTDNLQGKIGTDTELADRSMFDLLAGDGPASYPAAAAPANDVSLAEVLRAVYDRQLGDGTNSNTNSQLGKKVTRAAADVFDGTTTALFTVATGRVLVTHLEGEVTAAAIDAGASNTKLVMNPTVGTDRDLCAVLDINGDELGTIYTITGVASDALQGGSGGGSPGMTIRGVVCPEGTIDLSSAADVGTGGALGKFELWYIPLDDGATVASA